MAREGMLRNTGLRAARGTVETGGGTIRTAGNEQREAHIGRGNFINWYDDLGISTTEPQAQQIRKNEQDFKGKVSVQEGKISEAKGQLSKAEGQYNTAASQIADQRKAVDSIKIPDLKSAVDQSWNKYKSTLTPVRVIGPGDSIEAVYMLPKDAANKLIGQRGIFASWVDGGSNLNVMAKNYRNQELHDPLRESAANLENQYRSKAQEQIAKEIAQAESQRNDAYDTLRASEAQLADASKRISSYREEIKSAVGMLSGVKKEHQQQWDSIHGKYRERAAKMQEILGNLFVGDRQPVSDTQGQPGGSTNGQPGGSTNGQPGGSTNGQPGGSIRGRIFGGSREQPFSIPQGQPFSIPQGRPFSVPQEQTRRSRPVVPTPQTNPIPVRNIAKEGHDEIRYQGGDL